MANMTYAGVGIDYAKMDPFKLHAQEAASRTSANITRFGMNPLGWSRGESVFLIDAPDYYLAHVEEGLGTKNLVADAFSVLTGWTYYDLIAQDTVAMIVNDLATLGATPLSLAMHVAAGSSEWFSNERRSDALIQGWEKASNLARCVWGPGETPVLEGVICPDTVMLGGSALGMIQPKSLLIKGDIKDGDVIIFLESSGIHANGITLARRIANKLPNGYLTRIPGDRTLGAEILRPTHIYCAFIEDLLDFGIHIHYAINVTGHGWRKLMRSPLPMSYVIETLPKRSPIFDFLCEAGPIDRKEAYGNFNMGAGYAIILPERELGSFESALKGMTYDFNVVVAGYVRASGSRSVEILPENIRFTSDELEIRC